MGYKIRNIYLNNFKAFPYTDIPIKIKFSEGNENFDLFVLSGPNGYGKTSIFQAIELALIGRIEINSIKDSTKKFNENPICNEINKESMVALELVDEDMKYTTIVRYNEKVQGQNTEKCCEDYKLYLTNNKFDYKKFREEVKVIKSSDDNELIKKLGNYKELFWLYYIKQEQTSNFIFKTSGNRIASINNLIESEKKFNTIAIDKAIELKNDKKNTLEQELINIKSAYTHIQDTTIGEKSKNILVFNEGYMWDKQNYELYEDFYLYIQIVDKLMYIARNYIDFDKAYKINYFSTIIEENEKTKNMIKYLMYFDKIDEIKKYIRYVKFIEGITTKKELPTLGQMKDYLVYDYIIELVEKIRDDNNKLNRMSTINDNIYSKFLKAREVTNEYKEKFSEIFNHKCPVCGTPFETSKKLLQSIEDYSNEFTKLNKFITDEKVNLEQNIIDSYEKLENIVIDLKKSELYKPDIVQFFECIYDKSFKSTLKDDVERFKNNTGSDIECFITNDDYEQVYNYIKIYLEGLIYKNQPNEIQHLNDCEYIDYYKQIRLNCIKMKINLNDYLSIISQKLLDKRIELDWYFKKKQFSGSIQLNHEFNCKYENYKKVLYDIAKLNKIKGAINVAEKKYKEELIKYIKIPLYIYSGKLLQTHQNGLGVFCDTGNKESELTRIKFVTSNDNDQDLTSKFSSGQLSILTIASLLAFRKITNTKLKVLMIDDPCQTMDELNIASLVEILKNEFNDTQVIVSTHEDSIAGYMMYKYYKMKKSYRYYNVKEQLYKIDDLEE